MNQEDGDEFRRQKCFIIGVEGMDRVHQTACVSEIIHIPSTKRKAIGDNHPWSAKLILLPAVVVGWQICKKRKRGTDNH
jgi:hypothetical protein